MIFPATGGLRLVNGWNPACLKYWSLLVEAAYAKNKCDLLKRANSRLAVVRHLWRMAHELQTISAKRYEHGARLLEELGKQVGGWLKTVDTP